MKLLLCPLPKVTLNFPVDGLGNISMSFDTIGCLASTAHPASLGKHCAVT